MREFRAFILSAEGIVVEMHYLHCEDQVQAIESAKELAVTNPVELWDPPVQVARLEPKLPDPFSLATKRTLAHCPRITGRGSARRRRWLRDRLRSRLHRGSAAMARIFRGHAVFDMMHLQQMRDVIKKSRELLASNPVPSTFAGRKTQEPFPPADEETTTEQHLGSKELQPPK